MIKNLICFFLGGFIVCAFFIINRLKNFKCASKCGYNCNKCDAKDCLAKECFKCSKYLILILAIFFSFLYIDNVRADTYIPDEFSIGGVTSFPQGMWANGGNTNRIFTVYSSRVYGNNGGIDLSNQNFIVLTACVTSNSNSNWITNSGTDSSIQNGPVDTLNTGVSCSAGSSAEFQGTFYKFYFKIHEWGIPSGGSDNYYVSSYWNIGNPTEWAVYYWFYSIFITDNSTYLDDAMLVSSGKGQDTIINQNNTIISKSDEINNNITSDDSDVTSSKCGIICKLKGIFNGIVSLPSKIGELLKSLFIPTNEQLYEIVNDSKELSENFGFVGESVNFFITLFTNLLGLVSQNGCIEFPGFKLSKTSLFDEHIFWNAQNVCLSDNVILADNITQIRFITSIALICLFINFASSMFFKILSKNESYRTNADVYDIGGPQ